MENILSDAKSSYLLQHKDNEVAWQIWSKNTLDLAEKTGKPLFISIGYSSCHWCHVMAHESFEDIETAALINKYFIPVKIDREEHPDIDKHYQSFLQATKQHGGWPLSIFAFPDGRPFYGGTYFPKESIHGLPAFKDLLNNISELYEKNQSKLNSVALGFEKFLSEMKEVKYKKEDLNKLDSNSILDLFMQVLDFQNGGIKGQAKFPNIPILHFLLNNYAKDKNIIEFLNKTAKQLCFSGIYDHIEGGFYRYTVDEKWEIPHFEKMLYDNAQNSLFLTKLFDLTNDITYLNFAGRTLDFILNEFSTEYGIATSMDADSFNKENNLSEGYYYKIFDDDIPDLTKEEAELFTKYALFNDKTLRFKIDTPNEEYKKLIPILEKFSDKRKTNKLKPFQDTKVIASWNMLLCYALLEYSEVSADDYYFNKAVEIFHQIRDFLLAEGKVYRINYFGSSFNHRTLEDSSYFLFALTKFFDLTREKDFLKIAEQIIKRVFDDFYKDGILYLDLEKKVMDTFDEAIFSPFSIFIYSVIYFSNYMEVDIPDELLDFAVDRIMKFSIGHSTLIDALIRRL